ncbi:hypothetical protein ACIBG6_03945 [Streptomyces sp. NPDC050842]|uniref:hypothetical protein n=1 Tax=Streptomyces sp. NPDC050842 TaxID=3365636 RepID=UPI0037985A09
MSGFRSADARPGDIPGYALPRISLRLHLYGPPRLHLEVGAPVDSAGLLTDLLGPAV